MIKKFKGWITNGEVHFVIPMGLQGHKVFAFTKEGLHNFGITHDYKNTDNYNKREKDIVVKVKDLGNNEYELIDIKEGE